MADVASGNGGMEDDGNGGNDRKRKRSDVPPLTDGKQGIGDEEEEVESKNNNGILYRSKSRYRRVLMKQRGNGKQALFKHYIIDENDKNQQGNGK